MPVYYNGEILTMDEGEKPQAVAIQNGIVSAVGKMSEVTAAAPDEERVDLAGRSLLPAFVDAHSHITALAEMACAAHKPQKGRAPTQKEWRDGLRVACAEYVRLGYGTAQEGCAGLPELALLSAAAEAGELPLDVIAYCGIGVADEVHRDYFMHWKHYRGRFKIGGYKLFLDGEPRDGSAWTKNGGSPRHTDTEVEEAFRRAAADRAQLAVHCNGEAACEQMIAACLRLKSAGVPLYRPVMLHAQLLRPEQLPRVAEAGIIPSFFISAIPAFGDDLLKTLGERAQALCPAGSAAALGIPFTLHQDTPVLPPDPMMAVDAAVKRQTASGAVLGEGQRITREAALAALTANAAYQRFEENTKGKLKPGFSGD
ncbi:MAG TPA: amidohydrolase family protein, partial [Terriglobales bacterium]|nr:amidohydrolase family protein [Terriglobales bacterium]